ncbi:hypothetical protein [Solirhodobacter olei]|uniref:hypothetical protein n=1 Tax=Solirhodobacter olei TaxID=2493082 RepID=UPI000FDB3596|nr:hypothetical protein [Solirhodobacter olei]
MKMMLALIGSAAVSACSGVINARFDKPLAHPRAEAVGLWTSPEGCQNWYFIEGTGAFMTPRIAPSGKPVCNAPGMPPKAGAES